MLDLEADFDPRNLGFEETEDVQGVEIDTDEAWMLAYTSTIDENKVHIVLTKHLYTDDIKWNFCASHYNFFDIESGATMKEFLEEIIKELSVYEYTAYYDYFKTLYRTIKIQNLF